MHKKITSIMLLAAVVALAGCPKPQSPLPNAINASQLRVAVNGNLEAQGYALARSMDVVSQPFAGLQLYVEHKATTKDAADIPVVIKEASVDYYPSPPYEGQVRHESYVGTGQSDGNPFNPQNFNSVISGIAMIANVLDILSPDYANYFPYWAAPVTYWGGREVAAVGVGGPMFKSAENEKSANISGCKWLELTPGDGDDSIVVTMVITPKNGGDDIAFSFTVKIDNDGDGYPNADERAAGSDPNDPNSTPAGTPANGKPTITVQPAPFTQVTVGQSWSVNVTAAGATSYQWRKNGANVVNGNSAVFTIASVALADAGVYDVVVGNDKGTVTSNPAILVVLPSSGGEGEGEGEGEGDGPSGPIGDGFAFTSGGYVYIYKDMVAAIPGRDNSKPVVWCCGELEQGVPTPGMMGNEWCRYPGNKTMDYVALYEGSPQGDYWKFPIPSASVRDGWVRGGIGQLDAPGTAITKFAPLEQFGPPNYSGWYALDGPGMTSVNLGLIPGDGAPLLDPEFRISGGQLQCKASYVEDMPGFVAGQAVYLAYGEPFIGIVGDEWFDKAPADVTVYDKVKFTKSGDWYTVNVPAAQLAKKWLRFGVCQIDNLADPKNSRRWARVQNRNGSPVVYYEAADKVGVVVSWL